MKTRNFRKLFFAVALILVVGVAVSGCMNRNVNENPNVAPSPSPNYMPQGGATNNVTNNAAQSNAGGYDWTKNAAQIEAQLSALYARFGPVPEKGQRILLSELILAASQHPEVGPEDLVSFIRGGVGSRPP